MKTPFTGFFFLLFTAALHAQSVQGITNVTGGNYKAGHISLEWSVGEMAAISTLNDTEQKGLITSGLLQPGVMLEGRSSTFENHEVKILPNPTQGKLEINFLSLSRGRLDITVFDAAGKLLFRTYTYSYGTGNIINLNLAGYVNGNYFIRLEIQTEQKIRRSGTYKVIKI